MYTSKDRQYFSAILLLKGRDIDNSGYIFSASGFLTSRVF